MKTRSTRAAAAAVAAVLALAWVRPFATSMALVFAALILVAAVIARDAFVPDGPEER